MGRYHNIVLTLFASAAAAQQGVLTNGNSELPACGTSCPLLIQAANACSATDVASQGAWVCFCQSAYLTQLRTSATGICDSTCTNPTDLQQVSTWYNTNCGSDNGASAHAGDGSGTTGSAATGDQTTTDANGGSTDSNSQNTGSSGSSSSSGSSGTIGGNTLNGVGVAVDSPQTWWENHYKWIIMLIILAIAFPLIAWGAIWLKRRHDRKQDQVTSGFNAGITERQPPMSDKDLNRSTTSIPASGAGISGSGRNSPQRTRDAYMPYGYGYSRSDSRNSGRQGVHPLARGETPVEMVERGPHDPASGKGKRVLVREKSLGAGSSASKDGSWV
ncbi:hypothetical protein Slin15195_G114450 [Septoria linicola]|uniref:Integral membrane protein n=1 Tax=Septoria linicola TaxID=215465 RepID=A0A9Q9ENT4_9PEZI|nr:hypothetical protein Slin15195_G114450 [Septoria linicola]